MSTVVSICNMALARIGVSSYISSLNEASNEARNCALFYEPMRDFVLRDHPWNFAKKRVVLADAGEPPAEWGFKYAYPSDCLKVRNIVPPGMRNPRNDQRVQYEVANENGQRVIYTDLEEAELVYTYRVEDPTLYDSMFISALAYLLASEIAMPLSVSPPVAEQARKAYNQVVSMASAQSMSESHEGPAPESELITVRDGYSGQVTVFTQDN
jgi:hypothetical protein